MGLFFADKKPATPGPGLPHSHTPAHGQVTPREFRQDVMSRLRQSGMSEHDREIVQASAGGFLDKEPNGDIGMTARETGEFIEHLEREGGRIGLEPRDIRRVSDALNKSLE